MIQNSFHLCHPEKHSDEGYSNKPRGYFLSVRHEIAGTAKELCATLLSLRFVLFSVILAAAAPALAEPYKFGPDDCEFTMTFPEEPFLGRRCNPDDARQCQDVTSYMKVFDLAATLTINVTCNKAEKDMYARYSGDVMKTTLIAMAGRDRLDQFQTSYDERPEVKVAHLLGSGKNGVHDLIYVAQLWIGKKSVFSIEAEISGEYREEADMFFADILKTVTLKEWAEKAAKEAEALREKKAEEKPAATQEKQEEDAEKPAKR